MVSVVQDNIGYLPTIDAPATEMSTVNEILNQALKIMGQLSLQEITCVFDQALYAVSGHPNGFFSHNMQHDVHHWEAISGGWSQRPSSGV